PGASQDRDSGHRGGALRDQRAISVAVASIPEAKNFVVQSLCDLVATMAGGAPAPPPATVPPAGSTAPGTPPTGDGGVVGTLVAGPYVVERMRTLEVVWRGGTLGRDRPVDDPFLLLERQQPDAGGTLADTDLGWAFVWREHDGQYRARYDVAHDFPIGTYRVRIQSARYTLRDRFLRDRVLERPPRPGRDGRAHGREHPARLRRPEPAARPRAEHPLPPARARGRLPALRARRPPGHRPPGTRCDRPGARACPATRPRRRCTSS